VVPQSSMLGNGLWGLQPHPHKTKTDIENPWTLVGCSQLRPSKHKDIYALRSIQEIKSVNDVRKFTNPWYQELKRLKCWTGTNGGHNRSSQELKQVGVLEQEQEEYKLLRS